MVRFIFPAFVILFLALSCGRSNLYTYPPPTVRPDPIRLPDGGLAILLPDAGLEPYVPDAGPMIVCKPIESQTFTLPPKTKKPIDVLFVIDDSASMKNDQEAVAANFKSFISSFNTNEVDFQLGAVTTDMVKTGRKGELVTVGTPPKRFLVPGTTTLQKDFDEMVNVGVNGSPDEKGLAAARAALSAPLATDAGVNRGFLRPNADLGIVFVADEDDHDSRDVASFVTFFKSLKPDIAAISVSAIALQNGIICNTNNWRYVQVARAFGPRGLVSSCTPDYAETLKAIGGRLVGSHCVIGLKRWLEDGARVHVTVNGAPSGFIPYPPDEAYPNGSIQVLTCPAGGGTVELVYEECIESLP
jgi:hypothetical protein